MQTRKIALYGGLILLVLGVGSYFLYQYWKQDPPDWLVGIVSSGAKAPPLPVGDLAPFTAAEGYVATIYARDVMGARAMTRDPRGVLLVSSNKQGTILALPDVNGDGKADNKTTVVSGLQKPHGMYVTCGGDAGSTPPCTLYVGEEAALVSYTYNLETMTATNRRVLAMLPSGNGHFTRTLLPSADGSQIYISIGSSCNVCVEEDPKRASVQAYSIADGSLTPVATGLRNTVGLAFNPVTGELWGADNGRDLIGNDVPPDEINIIRPGLNYGWPYCYGKNVRDTDFGKQDASACSTTTPSHIDLESHAAALGISFIPESGWPESWWYDLLVAEHGSWNKSSPAGYKVVRIGLDAKGIPDGTSTDFLTGFMPADGKKPGDALGRPVDVRAEPGGVVFVSDDAANAIYRVVPATIR